MPVRLAAVENLTRKVIDQYSKVFYGIEVKSLRNPPTRGEVEIFEIVDRMYCDVVDNVDWSRITWEALALCIKNEHIDRDGQFCGQCLRDAMLATHRIGKDRVEPGDWHKDLVKALRRRKFRDEVR